MKITIIPADGAVYKDGVFYGGLDLSIAPSDIHALQWDGEKGWIEFVNESEFSKPANEKINQLPEWANDALLKWQIANDAAIQAQIQAEIASRIEPPNSNIDEPTGQIV